MLNFIQFIKVQQSFSKTTFGKGMRTKGICNHIRKELKEIEENPSELEEWVDVIILAIDGAWRSGHSAIEIYEALCKKQDKNMNRDWPDYTNFTEDDAIEHIK